MAKKDLDVRIRAHDQYSKELGKAELRFNAAAAKMGAVAGASAAATTKALEFVSGAARGVVNSMTAMVAAANVQEGAEKKLATALGYTSQALLDHAAALQRSTTTGDEAIIAQQAFLASLGFSEERIKRIIPVALDLAAATGMSLESAVRNTAKTFSGLAGELGELVPQLRGLTAEQMKAGAAVEVMAGLFGGHAAAQVEIFGGKVEQIKSQYGDLWEELGFVITRNQFFVKGLDVVTGAFASLANKIKENRIWLMELTKSGVLTLVRGLGYAVEVMRFFHNGWLGLKLVGQAVSLALADSINGIYKALRFLLLPLDLMYQGMMKLGLVDVNPFDAAQKAVSEYREVVLSVGADVLTEIEKTNAAYDIVNRTVKGIANSLQNIKAAQVDIAAGAPVAARVIVDEDAEKRKKKEAAGASVAARVIVDEEAEAAEKAREAARTQLAAMGEAPGGIAPEDEFSRAWLGYQAQLDALNQYNTQKLTLMQTAGFSEAELAAENARMVMDSEARKRDFQLSAAAQTFGGMSNIMQNLMVATGSRNKTMFKAMQGFAIAESLINTYQGATKAYATVPYPFNFVAAASVIAAGMAQVAKIRSQSPEGGGGAAIGAGGAAAPDYHGGSATAYPVPTRTEEVRPTQMINITVHTLTGAIDGRAQEEIIRAINEAGDRDVKIKATAIAGT